jgi:predicted DsbA family dithiol-disulfide isomerase
VRIEKLRRQYEIEVVWTHFPLHPDTPADGISLEEMFRGRNLDIPAMQARMQGMMADEGLPYGERSHTYNSRLAQELGKWADSEERGDAFHDAMFKAYFVEGQDISDVDTLVGIAEHAGLPADEARAVLLERRFQTAIDADWERSRAVGVTGVPTFAADGRGVVGAQPYEVLEQLVKEAGAIARTEK